MAMVRLVLATVCLVAGCGALQLHGAGVNSSSDVEVTHLPLKLRVDVQASVERIFPDSPQDQKDVQEELARIAKQDLDFGEYRASLDAKYAAMSPWETMFQKIREAKMHGAPMPDVNFDELATKMGMVNGMEYESPREAFTPTKYTTFDSWFLRHLSNRTDAECRFRASKADICAPVQGRVREHSPGGFMTLKVSVIAADALLNLMGGGGQLVQFALTKVDYHRVHSPADGTVKRIDLYEKDKLFSGSEAMTIITMETAVGDVKVMCIGEWSVQSFITDVKVGDELKKMDELGHFDFGSQVILVLPQGLDLVVDRTTKAFPGDPVAKEEEEGSGEGEGEEDYEVPAESK